MSHKEIPLLSSILRKRLHWSHHVAGSPELGDHSKGRGREEEERKLDVEAGILHTQVCEIFLKRCILPKF